MRAGVAEAGAEGAAGGKMERRCGFDVFLAPVACVCALEAFSDEGRGVLICASSVCVLGGECCCAAVGLRALGLGRRELCQEAEAWEPEGLTLRGREKGCEELRRAAVVRGFVVDAVVAAVVWRAGAELMRWGLRSVVDVGVDDLGGKGWIVEERLAGETSLEVQWVEEEGRSATNDCGRSPASEMGGGGGSLGVVLSILLMEAVRRGML